MIVPARCLGGATAALIVFAGVTAGCSDDSAGSPATVDAGTAVTGTATTGSETSPRPEATAAEVAVGLADAADALVAMAAAPSTATNQSFGLVELGWSAIERTVEITDAAAHRTLADALAAFERAAKAGDSAGLGAAAAAFSAATTAYLAAHPG